MTSLPIRPCCDYTDYLTPAEIRHYRALEEVLHLPLHPREDDALDKVLLSYKKDDQYGQYRNG